MVSLRMCRVAPSPPAWVLAVSPEDTSRPRRLCLQDSSLLAPGVLEMKGLSTVVSEEWCEGPPSVGFLRDLTPGKLIPLRRAERLAGCCLSSESLLELHVSPHPTSPAWSQWTHSSWAILGGKNIMGEKWNTAWASPPLPAGHAQLQDESAWDHSMRKHLFWTVRWFCRGG